MHSSPTPRMTGGKIKDETKRDIEQYHIPLDGGRFIKLNVTHIYALCPESVSQEGMYKGTRCKLLLFGGTSPIAVTSDAWLHEKDRAAWHLLGEVQRIRSFNFKREGLVRAMRRAFKKAEFCMESMLNEQRPLNAHFTEAQVYEDLKRAWDQHVIEIQKQWHRDKKLVWAALIPHKSKLIMASRKHIKHSVVSVPEANAIQTAKEGAVEPAVKEQTVVRPFSLPHLIAEMIKQRGGPLSAAALVPICMDNGWKPETPNPDVEMRTALSMNTPDMFVRVDPDVPGEPYSYAVRKHLQNYRQAGRHGRKGRKKAQQNQQAQEQS